MEETCILGFCSVCEGGCRIIPGRESEELVDSLVADHIDSRTGERCNGSGKVADFISIH